MNSPAEMQQLLTQVTEIAREACAAILEIYDSNNFVISTKADQSPITDADRLAHEIIEHRLSTLTPHIPMISEEAYIPEFDIRTQWPLYWLVDPIDGTREFIEGTGEFTINIALISKHQPILGVVCVPVEETYYCAAVGVGAYKEDYEKVRLPLQVRKRPPHEMLVLTSRRYHAPEIEAFLERLGTIYRARVGSSLKLCLIAEGEVDVYPRFGDTFEWDIAAGQCIIEQAGGAIFDNKMQPIRYNMHHTMINPPFVAVGDVNQDWAHFFEGDF